MFPLTYKINLILEKDITNDNLNVIISKNFAVIRNKNTIYGSSSLDCFIEENNIKHRELISYFNNFEERVDIFCDEESFFKILKSYLYSILKNNTKENINFILEQYILDTKLKIWKNNKKIKEDKKLSNVLKSTTDENFVIDINRSELPFALLLSTWILDRTENESILKYTKFYCWALLFSDLKLFFNDCAVDYYSRERVLLPELENMFLDDFLKTGIDILNFEDKLKKFREYFTIDLVKKFIHLNFINTRDENCKTSWDSPLELLYDNKYEELLLRDLAGPYKINYASDMLSANHVCAFLSYVYHCYRSNNIVELEKFRVKDT